MKTQLLDLPGYLNYESRYNINGGVDFGYEVTKVVALTVGILTGTNISSLFLGIRRTRLTIISACCSALKANRCTGSRSMRKWAPIFTTTLPKRRSQTEMTRAVESASGSAAHIPGALSKVETRIPNNTNRRSICSSVSTRGTATQRNNCRSELSSTSFRKFIYSSVSQLMKTRPQICPVPLSHPSQFPPPSAPGKIACPSIPIS